MFSREGSDGESAGGGKGEGRENETLGRNLLRLNIFQAYISSSLCLLDSLHTFYV